MRNANLEDGIPKNHGAKVGPRQGVSGTAGQFTGTRWREHEFVFTALDGQPFDGCRLNRQTKVQLHAAKLPRLKFHSLRHSCATFLLVQGVTSRVVMDIIAHSQISLTMNTYSHLIEQLQDGAAQEMTEPLWADGKA